MGCAKGFTRLVEATKGCRSMESGANARVDGSDVYRVKRC
jgi:hypothetical protein